MCVCVCVCMCVCVWIELIRTDHSNPAASPSPLPEISQRDGPMTVEAAGSDRGTGGGARWNRQRGPRRRWRLPHFNDSQFHEKCGVKENYKLDECQPMWQGPEHRFEIFRQNYFNGRRQRQYSPMICLAFNADFDGGIFSLENDLVVFRQVSLLLLLNFFRFGVSNAAFRNFSGGL